MTQYDTTLTFWYENKQSVIIITISNSVSIWKVLVTPYTYKYIARLNRK